MTTTQKQNYAVLFRKDRKSLRFTMISVKGQKI